MKILLLGATGRTGKEILNQILDRGYEVNCIVRDPAKLERQSELITTFKGSPDDYSVLENALMGCDYVISALNISRNSDFPWSKIRTPLTLMSDTMRNIVDASNGNRNLRVVVCSAMGVGESKKVTPYWFKFFIAKSNIFYAYEDHEKQENVLKNSNLKWTIVRPSGLKDGISEKKVIETYGNHPKPTMFIRRSSVARYMVDALTDDNLIGKAPVISA